MPVILNKVVRDVTSEKVNTGWQEGRDEPCGYLEGEGSRQRNEKVPKP